MSRITTAFYNNASFKYSLTRRSSSSAVNAYRAPLTGQVGIVDHRRFPVERQTSLGRRMTNAVEAPHKVQMPRGAAELAVCNGMIAGFLLLMHQIDDRLVLDGLQRGGVELRVQQRIELLPASALPGAESCRHDHNERAYVLCSRETLLYIFLLICIFCAKPLYNRQIQLYIVKLPIFTAGKSCIIPNVDKSEDQDTRVCGTFHVCGTILRKCRLFG